MKVAAALFFSMMLASAAVAQTAPQAAPTKQVKSDQAKPTNGTASPWGPDVKLLSESAKNKLDGGHLVWDFHIGKTPYHIEVKDIRLRIPWVGEANITAHNHK